MVASVVAAKWTSSEAAARPEFRVAARSTAVRFGVAIVEASAEESEEAESVAGAVESTGKPWLASPFVNWRMVRLPPQGGSCFAPEALKAKLLM